MLVPARSITNEVFGDGLLLCGRVFLVSNVKKVGVVLVLQS
jgi:hypothetical protein